MEPSGPDRDIQRAAHADLARLRHAGDVLGGLLGRGNEHIGAADAQASDPIEIWGRRIGRALGAVALVGLCLYLYATHVR